MDLTIASNVVALMESSSSEEEWTSNCAKVRAANGNDYPSFWFMAIMAAHVFEATQATWS